MATRCCRYWRASCSRPESPVKVALRPCFACLGQKFIFNQSVEGTSHLGGQVRWRKSGMRCATFKLLLHSVAQIFAAQYAFSHARQESVRLNR